MYWIIDGLCFIAGLLEFILSLTGHTTLGWWIGILWIIFYPFLLEGVYNLWAITVEKTVTYTVCPQSHIVYSPNYNLSFCGLEKMHPFDAAKYGNIYQKLIERGLVRESEITVPEIPQRSLLIEKMSKWYLLRLAYTLGVCKYIELPLIFMPGFTLRWRVLNPMLRATEGTILAACVAQKLKWSINLSGGFHHANFKTGGGFCIYPDISLVVHYLRTRLRRRRIMIIDLDAHQGNGHERDLIDDEEVYIVDFYNHSIYPKDKYAKKAIKKDVSIHEETSDAEYLRLVKSIEVDMDDFCPDFVIYNAGTDILENDPLGRLSITADGIIARDEAVVQMSVRRNIPVVMLLSGGYQKINAEIIADSVQNLLSKYD